MLCLPGLLCTWWRENSPCLFVLLVTFSNLSPVPSTNAARVCLNKGIWWSSAALSNFSSQGYRGAISLILLSISGFISKET